MIGVQDLTPVLEVLSSWISPAEILTLSGLVWAHFVRSRPENQFPKFEFSRQKRASHQVGDGLEVSGSEFRPDRPISSQVMAGKPDFPNLNFPAKKQANHQVGDGLEVSGSEFRPDRPIGSQVTAGKPDFPNLNFPAKNKPTIRWGKGWRCQVPNFGRIGRSAAKLWPENQISQI